MTISEKGNAGEEGYGAAKAGGRQPPRCAGITNVTERQTVVIHRIVSELQTHRPGPSKNKAGGNSVDDGMAVINSTPNAIGR